MSGIQESQTSESVLNAIARIGTEKKCSKCKKIKPIEHFNKAKGNKDGLRSSCRECKNEGNKKWYYANIKKIRERAKFKYQANPEITKERSRRWRLDNPKKSRDRAKNWRLANPERDKENGRKWDKNNRDKSREIKRRWRAKNPDHVKKWVKENPEKRKIIVRRHYDKRLTLPMARLNSSVSSLVRFYLKKNKGGIHWENLIGFTIKQLKKHLEKQFIEGMTWDNYGRGGWQIDHKLPVSAFNFTKPEHEDFKKCWALENLQPMWESENIIKSNKLTKHFQPSLLM